MSWEIENVKATYCCNRNVLKYFRERRGWTQSEFAKVAGYSERLISKAESGRSISSETVSNLAEALSKSDHPVYPEDLISDQVQSAKSYVAAYYIYSDDIMPAILPLLDENVVIQIAGDPKQIPFAGRHEGISGVEKFLELFFSVLQVPKEHDHTACYRYISQGNDVVVWGESWIHPIGKPMDKPMPTTNLIRFRRGKIIYVDDRYDTQAGAEAILKSQQET